MLERFLATGDFVDTDSHFVSIEINAQIEKNMFTLPPLAMSFFFYLNSVKS